MSRASWWRRRRPRASSPTLRVPGRVVRRRRCDFGSAWRPRSLFRTGVPIATFHRPTPAACGAFVGERRVADGDEGGCVRTRKLIRSSGTVSTCRNRHVLPRRAQDHRRACASLFAPFAAGVFARLRRTDKRPGRTSVRIATFRCNAPARCGAFGNAWGIVAGDEGG